MKEIGECQLYTFVDSAYLNGRTPADIARALRDGGADLVQLRAKDWSRDQVQRTAETLFSILAPAGIGLVINDYPEVAAAVEAPLCHLGQEDFFESGYRHVSEVRVKLGQERGAKSLQFGLSSHAPEQALRAVAAGADYVAIGPVYPTATKPGARPVTLDYVRWAKTNLHVPWFAIGGVNMETLDAVLEAGARRVCLVSAILNAPDIARACQMVRQRLVSLTY